MAFEKGVSPGLRPEHVDRVLDRANDNRQNCPKAGNEQYFQVVLRRKVARRRRARLPSWPECTNMMDVDKVQGETREAAEKAWREWCVAHPDCELVQDPQPVQAGPKWIAFIYFTRPSTSAPH